jgi:hypothetical protein
MSTTPPTVWALGPRAHGVTCHMLDLADALGQAGSSVRLERHICPPFDRPLGLSRPGVHHVPFTDALFGATIADAAVAFETFAVGLHGRLVVTFHDVPGDDPDRGRDLRRIAGYQRVADCADALIVCTPAEATRLRDFTGRRVEVVPLPVDCGASREALDPETLPTAAAVGVLGWVFPGKGHAAAITAAADTGIGSVVAIGGVAPGHRALADELRRCALGHGVSFRITGSLSQGQFLAAARSIAVPIAGHHGASASGSLRSWLAAGRIPLAGDSPEACALLATYPGALHLRAEGDRATLAAQAIRALHEPAWTRAERLPVGPNIGSAHVAIYDRVHAGTQLIPAAG